MAFVSNVTRGKVNVRVGVGEGGGLTGWDDSSCFLHGFICIQISPFFHAPAAEKRGIKETNNGPGGCKPNNETHNPKQTHNQAA